MSEHQEEPGLVLVAHENESLRAQASSILRAAGFKVVAVSDGESALLVLRANLPRVLVASVALRQPPFYALCDVIAKEELGTRVLIVSTVHSASAYKRAPTKLYGADACLEEHLLDQELASQVAALCQD